MIQFKDVSKKYSNGTFGVNNINITVESGEFVFLIGPSGSGKTTLIKMLIRDEKPTGGKIYFNDVDITHLSRRKIYLLRRQIGVIFQDYKLIPDKTVYENVSFAMEAAGKRDHEIKEKVPYLLDVVGLSEKLKAFPAQLSGGEQQRVAIARAMANNPKILIADEPTGNLDPGSAWDIVQILSKINAWGTTVVMSTHGTEIVNSLNKRVIQMEKGAVVRDDAEGSYEFNSIKKYIDNKIDVDANSTQNSENTAIAKKDPIKFNLSKIISSKESEKQNAEVDVLLSKLALWQDSHKPELVEDVKIKKQEDIKPEAVAEKEKELVVEKDSEKKEPDHKTNLTTSLSSAKDENSDSEDYSKAEQIDIGYLNLPLKMLEQMAGVGYTKLAQLIDDGPGLVAKNCKFTESEMQFVAKAMEMSLKDY